MAKPWYWDDQFLNALPRYLAKWYVTTYINRIEAELKKHKISDILNFTKGYYSTEKIGAYILSSVSIKLGKGKALHELPIYIHLCKIMHESKDPIVQDLALKIKSRNIKSINPALYGINPLLHESLQSEIGKAIQNTNWWNSNINEIRKFAHRTRTIHQVMES